MSAVPRVSARRSCQLPVAWVSHVTGSIARRFHFDLREGRDGPVAEQFLDMKRAPLVLAATGAGVAAVLSFHTKSARINLGALPSASTATGSARASGAGSSSSPSTTAGSTTPPASAPTTTVPSTTRTGTGPSVNYSYGVIAVSVTAKGKEITNIKIATLDDGGSYRSQSIDLQAIPLLEQQALAVQGANIQGVSGASYTSAGFEQSLQGALQKLGL
jgi:uncharacterized protein with FMN-binding domain